MPERHKWDKPNLRGGTTNTCRVCGCKMSKRRNQQTNHFEIIYSLPEQSETITRPDCKPSD